MASGIELAIQYPFYDIVIVLLCHHHTCFADFVWIVAYPSRLYGLESSARASGYDWAAEE
jgi:hypothetical protein